MQSDKIQSKETWSITKHYVESVQGHCGSICISDSEEQVFPSFKKFALPETASRLQGKVCCFSATCQWT
jgi:hypothetical protein